MPWKNALEKCPGKMPWKNAQEKCPGNQWAKVPRSSTAFAVAPPLRGAPQITHITAFAVASPLCGAPQIPHITAFAVTTKEKYD
jgi:hypothetical protein